MMTSRNGTVTVGQAQTRLKELRRARGLSGDAKPIGVSLPKICSSDEDLQRRRDYAREMAAYLQGRAEAERRELVEARWQASGVPERHRQAVGLRHTGTGAWLDWYLHLSDRLASGFQVPLLGPRGTGKTQMATCLLRDACERGLSARYVRGADLFADLRRGMHEGNEFGVVKPYRNCDVLAIDEVHERGHTDYEARCLTNLIDHRYAAYKTTLLISNQTPAGFAESVGSSIVSRIREAGETVVCDWPSFRRSGVSRE